MNELSLLRILKETLEEQNKEQLKEIRELRKEVAELKTIITTTISSLKPEFFKHPFETITPEEFIKRGSK